MRQPQTPKALIELGQFRLSRNFFMRDFLYSEVANIRGVPNVPRQPDLAIAAGQQLCQQVLEPLQTMFGGLSIRAGYQVQELNDKDPAENDPQRAAYTWDQRDADGYLGATVCIVINTVLNYYIRTRDWMALAWWMHDHLDSYSRLTFHPQDAAIEIFWSENPDLKRHAIYSFIPNAHNGKRRGYLTRVGADNYTGSHRLHYAQLLAELGCHPELGINTANGQFRSFQPAYSWN